MGISTREKTVLRLHKGKRAQKQGDKNRARSRDLVKTKFPHYSNKESSQIIQKYLVQSYPNMPFTLLYIIL